MEAGQGPNWGFSAKRRKSAEMKADDLNFPHPLLLP
jgi:hypothetical protein